MTKRSVIILSVLAAAVLLVSTAIAQLPQHNPQDLNFITVSTNVPSNVTVGNSFNVVLTMKNSANRAIFVDSIDVHDEWADGVRISAVNPPSQGEPFHIPGDNSWSYTMQQTIPPKSSLTVTFTSVAMSPGYHSGNIDVCVTYADCKVVTVSTTAK